MSTMELDELRSRPAPRTTTVLVFLAAFAVIISWLCCYAVTNALIAADLMAPWPREADPRWRWMLNSFAGVFIGFSVVGGLFRWLSNRQLRRIDAAADGE
jgi:threonine/homoserine/homoserine lactone efflux protein